MAVSESAISDLVNALAGAKSVAVLSGAGASAESGVPTFRDDDGLWKGRDPMQMATPQAFTQDPGLVWEWYDWRRTTLAGVLPNEGHTALAAIEARVPQFLLATQNVDRLHQAAGSKNVIELHGDIWTLQCFQQCGFSKEDRRACPEGPPPCPDCGGPLRPGVVWFGEALPDGAFEAAASAARGCEVFLVVGTSSVVYPAAGLTDLAARCGARVFEINPRPAASAPGTVVMAEKAGTILPRVVADWLARG